MLIVRRLRAVFVAFLTAALCIIAAPSSASAHVGFSASTPAEGDVVDGPVSVVTIEFTGESSAAGDGFAALTPQGVVQEPVSVDVFESRIYTLSFDPPLAGGQIGIRWSVAAADTHPIEGAFAFTVSSPAPVPEAAPATTAAVATEAGTATETVDPDPVVEAEVEAEADAEEAVSADAAAVDTGADSAAAVVAEQGDDAEADSAAGTDSAAGADTAAGTDTAAGADTAGAASDESPVVTQSLEEFLAGESSTPGEGTATIGRVLSLLGVALGIGTLAFAATALRGRRGEIDRALLGVRALGALIVVGAVVEYVGVSRIVADGLGGAWSTSGGFATVLRMLGGLGLVAGLGGVVAAAGGQRSVSARPLSAAVIDEPAAAPAGRSASGSAMRWTPTASSWPAIAGVVLLVVSFWFDGHTVTEGFRPLHAVVNSIHVLAGSIWVGGVVALAVIAWTRHRSGRSTGGVGMVLRFSKIATVALGSVVVAGAVMAVFVLDGPGDLFSTEWGQTLLLKTAAVALAAVGGAYNHFRLLPELEATPESPELIAKLRSTLTAESLMLLFVVVVTAWLVVAAP